MATALPAFPKFDISETSTQAAQWKKWLSRFQNLLRVGCVNFGFEVICTLLLGGLNFYGEPVHKVLYLLLAGHLVFMNEFPKASNEPLLYVSCKFCTKSGRFLVCLAQIVDLKNDAVLPRSFTMSNRL